MLSSQRSHPRSGARCSPGSSTPTCSLPRPTSPLQPYQPHAVRQPQPLATASSSPHTTKTSARRSTRSSTTTTCQALPGDLFTAVGAVALGLPATVIIDEALDTARPRVNDITNATTYGGVRLFVARPKDGGQHGAGGEAQAAPGTGDAGDVRQAVRRPGVVLIHQILGLQRREVELAVEVAQQEGVVAVAPDTFKGQSTLWPFRAIALGFKYALRDGASWGVESVHEAVTWLKAQPDVDPDRIIVAGWCYGGGAAVRYAAAHPGQAAGVAIFYGRPLLTAAEVARLGRTPVLGLYGTRDSQFPPDMLRGFEANLTAAGVPHRLELFEGEGHAFVKDVGATRGQGAAGRAWRLFREFVRQVAGGSFVGGPGAEKGAGSGSA